MALVDHHEGILREIFHQRRGRLARLPAGQVAGVVLDPRTVPHLLHHLDIEKGSLLQPLRLQKLVFGLQRQQPHPQFLPDPGNRPLHVVPGGHIVAPGIDGHSPDPFDFSPAQRIDQRDRLDRIPEELHADRPLLLISGENLDDVAPDAERSAMEIDVVPLVLDLDETRQHCIPRDLHPLFEQQQHPLVGLRGTQTVDAGNAGHDDHVPPLQQCIRGRVAELVDFLVDRGVLLDVGVGAGKVGLGLIIVVVTDEIFDGVVREEALEFPVELGGKGLVVGDHQGRPVDRRDHVRHREGLSGTGHSEQHLVPQSVLQPLDEAGDGLRLIPPRLKLADQTERSHNPPPVKDSFTIPEG